MTLSDESYKEGRLDERKIQEERFKEKVQNAQKRLKGLATKPIYLDFDRKPTTKDSENLAYCGGCNGDFLEVGCNCGFINVNKVDKIFLEEFGRKLVE